MALIKSLLFSFCFLLFLSGYSQGRVEIVADKRLETLVKKHVEFNEQSKTVLGYRIRISSFSGAKAKEKALELKSELMNDELSKMRTYVIYDEPNFTVKYGDFISRLDAHASLQAIKKTYPHANIVRDDVNLSVVEPENVFDPLLLEEHFDD